MKSDKINKYSSVVSQLKDNLKMCDDCPDPMDKAIDEIQRK